jgi:putative addiction module antidote
MYYNPHFYMNHPLKVRQVGSSLGVILPREVIHLLNVNEGDTIFIDQSQGAFRIVAHDPNFPRAMKAYRKIARRYRNALHELAQ